MSIDYPAGTVPNISVQLETANGRKRIVGDIDSGSDRSLCPIMFAEEIGIPIADLEKDDKRGMPAVGEIFDTWSPRGVAITGQIVLPHPEENDFVCWGPMFPMRLTFADTETLLLGQRDFFGAFDLKFLNKPQGSVIEICECQPRPVGP